MVSGAEITIKDTGWSIIEDLNDLDGELQAGVLDGTADHDGISTAELALIHEDGAPRANIPARPFMRPTFDQHADSYGDKLERVVMRTVKGAPGGPQLAKLADEMAADMRKTILRGEAGGPPLRPVGDSEAAARRRGLIPLVDTGQLVESLQGQVKGGGSG